MLRRLHPEQPESFAFTDANLAWAEAQMTKFPEGRQASAVIPLLWRAQEQEGWLTRPAIEEIGRMLGLAYIRVLEVATFYFMFQLQPVGRVAHIQICGTTSCMICGAEDLVAVCRDKIARRPHQLSADGRFSWEEVECLGACANAPMAQIGKDYYEDLTAEKLAGLLDEMAAGRVPVPGPQNGRYAAEPLGGLTSLKDHEAGRPRHNASVGLAVALDDTIKRIDGTEVPLVTPWQRAPEGGEQDAARDTHMPPSGSGDDETPGPKPSEGKPADDTGVTVQEAQDTEAARPALGKVAPEGHAASGDEISADGGHAAAGSKAEADGSGAASDANSPAPGLTVDDATRPAGAAIGGDAEPAGEAAAKAPARPASDTGGATRPERSTSDTGRAATPTEAPARPAADPEPAAAQDAPDDAARPASLDAPRGGKADDLKRIKGVGPKLESLLHDLGYYHFDQIAAWTPAEVAWVDDKLNFKGRIMRDDWLAQAADLAG